MEENAVVFSNDMARLLKQHLPLVLSFINARSEESSSQPLNEAIHSLKNFENALSVPIFPIKPQPDHTRRITDAQPITMEKNKTPSIQDDEFPFGHSRFKLAFLKDSPSWSYLEPDPSFTLKTHKERWSCICTFLMNLTLSEKTQKVPDWSSSVWSLVLVMDRNLEDWVENRNGYTDKSFEAVGLLDKAL
ncbi:hypothetical protein C8J56DRAFT_895070 [Mycena floridula]|nr:hypothetical protein C8J56DRAFT_895070 [Mycena floridula]